jgi:hypothetical protein
MFKLPTGDKAAAQHREGRHGGRRDRQQGIQPARRTLGYAGFIIRGQPRRGRDHQRTPLGPRRRLSVAKSLRLTVELNGEKYTNDTLETKALLLGTDGSFIPVASSRR